MKADTTVQEEPPAEEVSMCRKNSLRNLLIIISLLVVVGGCSGLAVGLTLGKNSSSAESVMEDDDDDTVSTYWPTYSPTYSNMEATIQNYSGNLVSVDSKSGTLVYAKYANQGESGQSVNTVPDYSMAGYKGGGVPIPFIKTKEIVYPTGMEDDYQSIQAAIDRVSNLPLGDDGFRGAVLLKRGDYHVSKTLTIETSGVVIRGEGSQTINGTRVIYTAGTQSNMFEVGRRRCMDDNESLWRGAVLPVEIETTRGRITDLYVPVGAKMFNVSQGGLYRKGDNIVVLNDMNEKWLHDISRMQRWGWKESDYKLIHRRVVTEVVGNTIHINAPVVQAIEEKYGGGFIYKYTTESEQIKNIGFEGLRLESTYASEEDEEHGWIGIAFSGIKNGWVRQVTGLHFAYGLFSAQSRTSFVTVEDSAMLDHKSEIRGGRRYSFNLGSAEFILMQRLLTREGRHDFVSHTKTPGPNVFLDSAAKNTYSDIGPHHRYSTGQLYDNILGDNINVRNRRGAPGKGHGWSGAQIMFWNVKGDVICDAPEGAMNWAVGVDGVKKDTDLYPFGIWESNNEIVTPRSLYQAQLQDRMGPNALHGIILPQQRLGRIWNELIEWDGEGLFLDPVLTWFDVENMPNNNMTVNIGGAIRDLKILEVGFTSLWESDSMGVTIADPSSLHTTVEFSSFGLFELELVINYESGSTSSILEVII